MNLALKTRFLWAVLLLTASSPALSLDIVSMYRGSCRVDTGVLLGVDARKVIYLDLLGRILHIPRYEVVGMAIYPLPGIPVDKVRGVGTSRVDFVRFETFRNGTTVEMATGWPIEFNSEHIQVLRQDGTDHLVKRDEIWGVEYVKPPPVLEFQRPGAAVRYDLKHPLAFAECEPNITPGTGPAKTVIPHTQFADPIRIKKYHDRLRRGHAKIRDYADRQRFYAVPQTYTNRTEIGTWAIIGSRYTNIGSRQSNFFPLVQDEFSEGPFGFQRVFRSGVAPIDFSLHEEPIVQIYYGLKADYIHLKVFMDPTSPLIGEQYNWQKDQLNEVDDRLIEKGGLEFGFDVGYGSVFFVTGGGNFGLRVDDYFASASFSPFMVGVSGQYNRHLMAIYAGGSSEIRFDDDLAHELKATKLLYKGPLSRKFLLELQYISRRLKDKSPTEAPIEYESATDTVAAQIDWRIDYRWTLRVLTSMELQDVDATNLEGETRQADEAYFKLASGLTVAF